MCFNMELKSENELCRTTAFPLCVRGGYAENLSIIRNSSIEKKEECVIL